MDEETERRIEEARQQGERKKETAEFLESLKPGDEVVRPIYNPEAWVLRDQLKAAASRGELPPTNCPHPFERLRQYEDEDPSVKRRGLPVNLFECGVCHHKLWLVDPWGKVKADG